MFVLIVFIEGTQGLLEFSRKSKLVASAFTFPCDLPQQIMQVTVYFNDREIISNRQQPSVCRKKLIQRLARFAPTLELGRKRAREKCCATQYRTGALDRFVFASRETTSHTYNCHQARSEPIVITVGDNNLENNFVIGNYQACLESRFKRLTLDSKLSASLVPTTMVK